MDGDTLPLHSATSNLKRSCTVQSTEQQVEYYSDRFFQQKANHKITTGSNYSKFKLYLNSYQLVVFFNVLWVKRRKVTTKENTTYLI